MRLYVWRSSWDGMWHVSRGPGRNHYGARFWTHAEAFADAWARTHPKET